MVLEPFAAWNLEVGQCEPQPLAVVDAPLAVHDPSHHETVRVESRCLLEWADNGCMTALVLGAIALAAVVLSFSLVVLTLYRVVPNAAQTRIRE